MSNKCLGPFSSPVNQLMIDKHCFAIATCSYATLHTCTQPIGSLSGGIDGLYSRECVNGHFEELGMPLWQRHRRRVCTEREFPRG